MLNETHDVGLRSWEASANVNAADFPIQNLPFSIMRRSGTDEGFRGAVAIGDFALDLGRLAEADLMTGRAANALASCKRPTLNDLMSMGSSAWSELRHALSRILRQGADEAEVARSCMIPLEAIEYRVPAQIGDYTDFYASIHHATNIGRQFRPDNPLLPNYQWVPIGYHGRSSSIAVSGHAFPRPSGQLKPPEASQPILGPCKRLDYELEVGIFIGAGNQAGSAINIDSAQEHVFGLCLLNDWSARDIQAWEYQPLGPFLGKNFASTISPWIVTMEALAPFQTAWHRDAKDPQPLPYLSSPNNSMRGAIDMQLEVLLHTESMRKHHQPPVALSHSNFTDAYWTVAQMVAHHTVNGCNLCPGDLFGSGTMSGPARGTQGALIEITQGGEQPLSLPNGETRTFLEDGDSVIMRAWCERDGAVRIGFGEVEGTVLPAVQ